MTDYKIVFVDMDGTLLNEEKQIPKENIKAIKEIRKLGIPVVLASGKSTGSLSIFCKECSAGPYVVASNGALVQNIETGEIVYSKEVSKKQASTIYEIGGGMTYINTSTLVLQI